MNTETVDNFSCYFRWPEVGTFTYNGKNVLYVNYFITLQENSQASVKKLATEIHFVDSKKTSVQKKVFRPFVCEVSLHNIF